MIKAGLYLAKGDAVFVRAATRTAFVSIVELRICVGEFTREGWRSLRVH